MGIDSLLERLQATTTIVQDFVTSETSLKKQPLHVKTELNQRCTPVTYVTSDKINVSCDELPNSLPRVQVSVLSHIDYPNIKSIDVTSVTNEKVFIHKDLRSFGVNSIDVTDVTMSHEKKEFEEVTRKRLNQIDLEVIECDHRRPCLECRHLLGRKTGSWRCANWKTAGIAIRRRDAQLPAEMVVILQNCDGFKSLE